jgi:hypothetical protein
LGRTQHSRFVQQKKEFFFRDSPAILSFSAQRSGAKNLALDFSADEQQGEIDGRPPTPGQLTVKAHEKTAFSGLHGLVVSMTGKGAEVADVLSNLRCGNIRYNSSPLTGVCQALNSDLLTPKEINMSRLCK